MKPAICSPLADTSATQRDTARTEIAAPVVTRTYVDGLPVIRSCGTGCSASNFRNPLSQQGQTGSPNPSFAARLQGGVFKAQARTGWYSEDIGDGCINDSGVDY